MGREIVTLQVGQAGNQVGTQFWDAIRKEHNLTIGGKFAFSSSEGVSSSESSDKINEGTSVNATVMFNPTNPKSLLQTRWVPRGLLIDLEPGTLDDVKNHFMGSMFKPDNLVFGQSGAGNNWAKGHYTEGPELVDVIMDRTRLEVESCEAMQGFQLIHSLGGGTGSGLGSLLLNSLRDNYPDKISSTYSIFPSKSVSGTVVEPYNSVLTIHQILENSDVSFVLDNEALHNVAKNTLNVKKPGFQIMNKLIARIMCGVTASLRFPGTLNSDLRKLGVNLVPFPRLHFFLSSQGPISDQNTSDRTNLNVREVVRQCFSTRNMFCHVNPKDGKYMAAALMFRGSEIAEQEVDAMLAKTNNSADQDFVEWIPNNLQASIISVPSLRDPLSGTLVANTTSLKTIFQRISTQFSLMYRRKAFIHYYRNEGMDEMEFEEADKNVRDLRWEYEDKWTFVYDPEAESDEEDDSSFLKEI